MCPISPRIETQFSDLPVGPTGSCPLKPGLKGPFGRFVGIGVVKYMPAAKPENLEVFAVQFFRSPGRADPKSVLDLF